MVAGMTPTAASVSDCTSRARLPRHREATSKRGPTRLKPCSLCAYHVSGSWLIGAMSGGYLIYIFASPSIAFSCCCCPLIPLAVSIDDASGKIAVKHVHNWLQVILNVEFGSKAYLARGFSNTDEPRRMRLLWC